MGSSDTAPVAPAYHQANINEMQGGQESLRWAENLRNEGLGQQFKDSAMNQLSRQLSGNTRAGTQAIREASGQGMTAGSMLGNIGKLYGANTTAMGNLQDSLTQQDFGAKMSGNQNYLQLMGLLNSANANQNQFAMSNYANQLKKYQLDQEGKFDWGGLLGGAFKMGGNILSGGLAGGYL